MKTGKTQKLLLFVLALALAVSSFSMVVFAEGDEDLVDAETIEEIVEEEDEETPAPEETVEPEETEDDETGIVIVLVNNALDQIEQAADEINLGNDLISPAKAVIVADDFIDSITAGSKNLRYQVLYDDDPTWLANNNTIIAIYPTLEDDDIDDITISFDGVTINGSLTTVNAYGSSILQTSSTEISVDLTGVDFSSFDHSEVFFQVDLGDGVNTPVTYDVTFYATVGIEVKTEGDGSGSVSVAGAPDTVKSLYVDPGQVVVEVEADSGSDIASVELVKLLDPTTPITTYTQTGDVYNSTYTYTLNDSAEYVLTVTFREGGSVTDPTGVIESVKDEKENSIRYEVLNDGTIAIYPTIDEPGIGDDIIITFDTNDTVIESSVNPLILTSGPTISGNTSTIKLVDVNWSDVTHQTVFYQIAFDGKLYNVTYYATAGLTATVSSGGYVTLNGSMPGSNSIFVDPGDYEIIPVPASGYRLSSFSVLDSDGNDAVSPSDNIYTLKSREYYITATFTRTTTSSGSGSSSSGGNGGSYGGSSTRTSGFTASSTSSSTPVSAADATSAINAGISEAQASGSSTATAKFTNAGTLSASAMSSITQAAQAAGLTPSIQADSVVGSAVTLRMTFNPTGLTADIELGGAVSGTAVDSILNLFKNNFTNKLAVVRLNHTGAYGTTVRMAAKVDLSGMDTENLVLYSYNTQTNRYSRIQNPNYRIDANGYLWFSTSQGGAVIISEGALTK